MHDFLTVEDIEEILNIKRAKAYEIIRALNKEMEQDGYMVLSGKVNRQKFEERFVYQGKSVV